MPSFFTLKYNNDTRTKKWLKRTDAEINGPYSDDIMANYVHINE